MKKIIYVVLALWVIFIGNIYADISQWKINYFVDEFGDITNHAFLDSESINIYYGSYAWEDQFCKILIDDTCVSFYLGRTFYQDWIVKTKTPDGNTNTYYCDLDECGRVYMRPYNSKHKMYVHVDRFISELLLGSRVIVYPDNKYTNNKYDFGIVSLKMEDLRKIRPDFEAKK